MSDGAKSAAISEGTRLHRGRWIPAVQYSGPQLGLVLLTAPVYSVLAGIYAKHFGLALTTIAGVMLAARIFDAVTDPVIGVLSDRDRLRTGTRKRFIAIGGLLFVPCAYFLLSPPEGVTATYFTFWYFAFYLTLTIFLIPYMAWANEFTRDSQDKTRVFSALSLIGLIGGASFYFLPMTPLFGTDEITPEVLQVAALVGGFAFVLLLAVTLKFVPDGVSQKIKPQEDPKSKPFKVLEVIVREMLQNRPFLIFVGAFMLLGIGAGMWGGMFFIFVDVYLQ